MRYAASVQDTTQVTYALVNIKDGEAVFSMNSAGMYRGRADPARHLGRLVRTGGRQRRGATRSFTSCMCAA